MPRVKLVPGDWGALADGGPRSEAALDARARELLAQMTLEEKIDQMSGDTPLVSGLLEMARAYNARPLPAGENLRLGIPGIRFSDGPRGVVMYHSTCFPVSMARGATWDVDLEERIGDAMGVEARSQGANFFGGVCVNLLRHPAWGRAQETYGEDPYHLGEMGAALVRGVQRHVMACVKHYAANSLENTRTRVDVRLTERVLREVYLPHFKRCIDEGAAAVMSAYNKVNGEHCGHNAHLLRDILKGEWGFQGFVISDFVFGIHDGRAAVEGGLDVEMPFTIHYGRRLRQLVRGGAVPQALIDDAVRRILRQKLRFAQVGEPGRYGPHAVASPEHRALAREAARKGMVLLQNDPAGPGEGPLLPLDLAGVRRLAVLGRLAAVPNTGDRGSSRVRPPYVVTPLEGIRAAVGERATVVVHDGRRVRGAAEAARGAGAAVVVAGYDFAGEGEAMVPGRGGDRASLSLSAHDEALIQAVAAANPRTVVVLMGGSAIVTEAWRRRVPAILVAWYPGMEGGHALADVLFGREEPGGRLPCVWPRSAADLPFFDRTTTAIDYGLLHGYRLLDHAGCAPAFPFGFGLGYTTFRHANLRLDPAEIGPDDTVQVCLDVTNTGQRPGDDVIQLYTDHPGGPAGRPAPVEHPVKELKAFARVHLEPGETRTVALALPAARLAWYDDERPAWTLTPGRYRVWAGPSSAPGDLLAAEISLHAPPA